MKKNIILLVFTLVFGFLSCDSNTYEEIQDDTTIIGDVSYEAQVKAIIDANCVSCHSPGGLSAFRPLTNYLEVKEAFQETNLVSRIQRQNGEPGQMPQTGRMPQDKIDIIIQWGSDGLLEN